MSEWLAGRIGTTISTARFIRLFCGQGTGCGEPRIKLKFEKYVDRAVLWIKKHDEPALQRWGRREYLLVNGIGELEERTIEKVN